MGGGRDRGCPRIAPVRLELVLQHVGRLLRGLERDRIEVETHVGKTYGRLTVEMIGWADRSRKTQVKCTCRCGRETWARLSDLKAGHTRSCGCRRGRGPDGRFRRAI